MATQRTNALEGCIDCVGGNKYKFFAANALAIGALAGVYCFMRTPRPFPASHVKLEAHLVV